MKIKYSVKRFISMLLCLVLTLTDCQLTSFAVENKYESSLDGWNVDIAWDNLSYEYEWNAESNSQRQPKMIVTYRLYNAEHDYPAGSVRFVVPGIGNINRTDMSKADKLAADDKDSEWDYTWDELNDVYTFTNRFDVKTGQTISGGFELIWTLDARDCENGFNRKESPMFAIQDVGSINLEPLTFKFTSTRDRYRLNIERDKITAETYIKEDNSYIWYNFKTAFDKDKLARGLYKSTYKITVEVPDSTSNDEVVAKVDNKKVAVTKDSSSEYSFSAFKDKYGDLNTDTTVMIGFKKSTLLDNQITVSGHLDRLYNDENEWVNTSGDNENVDANLSFIISDYGFKADGYGFTHGAFAPYEHGYKDGDMFDAAEPSNYTDRLPATEVFNGKVLSISLYAAAKKNYSETKVGRRAARKINLESDDFEQLEDWNDINWKENGLGESDRLSGTTYGDLYPGYIDDEIIDEDIIETEESEKETEPDETEPEESEEETEEEKEKETEQETENNIEEETEPTETETEADESEEETEKSEEDSIIDKISAYVKSKFIMTSYAAEVASPSNIKKSAAKEVSGDAALALVLGNDKFATMLNSGAIRNLEDGEYDIISIDISRTNDVCHYDVFGADTQDTEFNSYVILGSGDTSTSKRIILPDGVKAVFVRVNNVNKSYEIKADVNVRLHVDWNNERQKDINDQIDRNGKVINFTYVRAIGVDEDGNEFNGAQASKSNYKGDYGQELAERDYNTYGEYLARDYSNIWLRNPVTTLYTEAKVNDILGNSKTGFETNLHGVGKIQSDNDGSIRSFSMYFEIPDGMTVNIDEDEVTAEGTTDFQDHMTVSEMENHGKKYLVCDFDFSDSPLQANDENRVEIDFPARLSGVDYATYGNAYTLGVYLMCHDDGLDQFWGSKTVKDEYDLDGNSLTDDVMAVDYDTATLYGDTTEWREYEQTYVKSEYSGRYVDNTVARLYSDTDTVENKKKSEYGYRLDFGLGSNNAKNLILYDRIEQGTGSEWNGTLVSVDTSYAESMGLIPTVYYSLNENADTDLDSGDWTTERPVDNVKSVAIKLDTSELEDGMLKTKQLVYVTLNMRASDNKSLVDKTAVNNYIVQYDAYGLTGDYDNTYKLPSSSTQVVLMDTVGKVTLQKIDATSKTKLTGAKIQVYDSTGNTLLETGGRYVNTLGNIVLNNVHAGDYYWEEIEAPEGYEKAVGKHKFTVVEGSQTISIENKRIAGTVTLTKLDADNPKHKISSSAYYGLYSSKNEKVYVSGSNGVYEYDEDKGSDIIKTGADSKLKITGLPWDSYYIKEVKSPDGYLLNKEELKFNIGKNEYSIDLTQTDEEGVSSIRLTKYDDVSDEKLKNAYYNLELQDEDGTYHKVKDSIKTNAVGELIISDLKFGKYRLVEVMPPEGYNINKNAIEIELNESTVDTVVDVEHRDTRKTGSAKLIKQAVDGLLLQGAEFSLYRVPQSGRDKLIKVGLITDGNGETETVENLEWGDYYFLEDKAPSGYKLNSDKLKFSINSSNAGTVHTVRSTNSRILGTVVLTKLDEVNKDKKLSGAEFKLYKNDGTLVKSDLVTDTDGKIKVTDLDWGSYYFEEIKAPAGYGLSDKKIRFSVNEENSSGVQELTCYNKAGSGSIKINKELNDVYTAFGNSTSIFEIYGTDISGESHKWVRQVTIKPGDTSGYVNISDIPAGTYNIKEKSVSRYKLDNIVCVENTTVIGNEAIADLRTANYAEVTFKNEISQYEKFSHTTNTTNIINKKAYITSLIVEYTGPDLIQSSTESIYKFTSSDLTAKVVYDDGTVKAVPFNKLTLSPSEVTGSNNTSGSGYTVNVSYTEDGITVSDCFNVEIALKEPKLRFTVTYDANGGYFDNDTSITTNQVTYVMYNDTLKIESGTEKDPEHLTEIFYGWEKEDGSAFVLSKCKSDIRVYAEWGQPRAELAENAVTLIRDVCSGSINKVTEFVHSDVAPDNSKITAKSIVSTADSEAEIYVWLDGTVLKWWSKADTIVACNSLKGLFKDFKSLRSVSGLYDIDVENTTTIEDIFSNCQSLVDIAGVYSWNTPRLTNIVHAFKGCKSLDNISALTNWDVSAVSNMQGTFDGCTKLSDLTPLRKWDTSSCINTKELFQNCTSIRELDALADWQLQKDKNPSFMFYNCTNLEDISALTKWRFTSALYTNYLFGKCKSLSDVSVISNWSFLNLTSMIGTFAECESLIDISVIKHINTSKVTDFSHMFRGCKSLISVEALANLDTSNVTTIEQIFRGCSSLEDISALSNWDVHNIKNMAQAFRGCSSLTDLSALSNWVTSSLTNMYYMLADDGNLRDISGIKNFDTSHVTNMSGLLFYCVKVYDLNVLSDWNVQKVTDMSSMLGGCKLIDDITPLGNWKTISLTNMYNMLASCSNIVDVTPLGNWDTSHVTNISDTFNGCINLENISALSKLDVSHVTNMNRTFKNCRSLVDVSALALWNVSNVKTFDSTFENCIKISNMDKLNDWDVRSGTSFKNMCLMTKHPTFKRKGSWNSSGTFVPLAS